MRILSFVVGSLIGTAAQGAPIVEPVPNLITGVYQLPDGDVYLDRPIKAINQENVRIFGGKKTRVFYIGPPTELGVFQFHGIHRGQIGGHDGRGFDLICVSGGVKRGILLTNSDIVGGSVSTDIHVIDVHIRHGGQDNPEQAFDYGFSVDSYAGDPKKLKGGTNNEYHKFFNCTVENCRLACFHINGHQAHKLLYQDCAGVDAGYSVNGVRFKRHPYGIHAEEGSYFIAIRCSFNSCRCDYQLGWPNMIVTIQSPNSEHSKQFVSNVYRDPETGFIYKVGGTEGKTFLSISDGRWDGEPRGSAFPVIDLWGAGPLKISNTYLAGINGVCPEIEMDNYSDIVGGQWVPKFGTTNFDGLMIRQHSGVRPTKPIVRTPWTWKNKVHGLEYEYLKTDGSFDYKRITPNELLP